jgi:P27 family predicted phage terminase small subunit
MRRLPGEGKPTDEPVHAKGQRPKMPVHLSPIAQERWKEIVKMLHKRGTITKADGPAIEILCEQYARWRACQDEILANGVMVEEEVSNGKDSIYTRRSLNPACKLATMLENSMRAMLQQIGSTPASRERSRPAKIPPTEAPLPPGSAGAIAGDLLNELFSKKPREEKHDDTSLDDFEPAPID